MGVAQQVTVTLNFTDANYKGLLRAMQDINGTPDAMVQVWADKAVAPWTQVVNDEAKAQLEGLLGAFVNADPDTTAKVQTLITQATVLLAPTN